MWGYRIIHSSRLEDDERRGRPLSPIVRGYTKSPSRSFRHTKRLLLFLLLSLILVILLVARYSTSFAAFGASTVERAVSLPPPEKIGKWAYVNYATNDDAICQTLIAFDSLKATSPDSRIDKVVLVPSHVSEASKEKITAAGYRLIVTPELERQSGFTMGGTWTHSLHKLMIFSLIEYSRVVYFDNDVMVRRNLDHLFRLAPWPIYAPRAYWLQQPIFQSTLLVIEPSTALFTELQQTMERTGGDQYDMDVLNTLLKDQVAYLPSQYMILNGDLNNSPDTVSTKLLGGWTTDRIAKEAYVFHFSESPSGGYGKPIHDHPAVVHQQPNAHPLYASLFEQFWQRQDALCRAPRPKDGPLKTSRVWQSGGVST